VWIGIANVAAGFVMYMFASFRVDASEQHIAEHQRMLLDMTAPKQS